MVARRGRQTKLGEDAGDVPFDSSLREYERLRDAFVRPTFGYEPEHVALARREVVERTSLASPRHEPRDDVRVDDGLTGRETTKRVFELAQVGDAVLRARARLARSSVESSAGISRTGSRRGSASLHRVGSPHAAGRRPLRRGPSSRAARCRGQDPHRPLRHRRPRRSVGRFRAPRERLLGSRARA